VSNRAILFSLIFASISLPAVASEPLARASALYERFTAAYGSGDHERGVAIIDTMLNETPVIAVDPHYAANALYDQACSAALAGDPELALASLDRAVDLGYLNADHAQSDTDLASLHDDSRFLALIGRINDERSAMKAFWDGEAIAAGDIESLTDVQKIAGLSRLWSETKFAFAFFDQVPELDWDQAYLEAIPRILATTTTVDYYRELQRLVALLGDGHSNVYPPRELRDQFYARLPILTRRLGDDVVVVEVNDEGLRESGVVPGSVIEAIDGEDVRDFAAREIEPFISASTPQDRDNRVYGNFLFAGPVGTKVNLMVRGIDDHVFEVEGERILGWSNRLDPVTWRREDDFGVIAINTFDGSAPVREELEKALEELSDTTGLILDIRANGGGNSGWWVMRYFVDSYTTSSWKTRRYLPAYRAWQRKLVWHETAGSERAGLPEDQRYPGSVALLTSARTYSAAEDLALVFDASGIGPIVGQTTGGSTGQPLPFRLPGGGRARICSKRDMRPDGSDWVGVGIRPDIEIEPTLADVRAGRDPALERAIAELRNDGR
jgi:C-terminal processing protease CtpA/Prc